MMITHNPSTFHRNETLEAHQASVERVIDYMKTYLEEALELEHLAQIAAVSKFHFVKIFEESTGTTPHHFLACLRMQRAKERLLHSEASITEICMEVGYSSLGSFSQTFHDLVGVSPREFRAMLNQLTLRAFAGAVARWIASYRNKAGPQLAGVIQAPPKPRGFIFVGAFPKGVPQGVPISGTVLLRPGAFHIARPLTAEFHVLAALIPFSAGWTEVVANQCVELVASQRLNGGIPGQASRLELRLRHLRATDPPLVMALPALLR